MPLLLRFDQLTNDNFDHFESNRCHFAFAHFVTTFIFLSAGENSRVKWANARNSTQKIRTLLESKYNIVASSNARY